MPRQAPTTFVTTTNITRTTPSTLWHARLGHPSIDILQHALASSNVSLQRNNSSICTTY